jgi:hypothetical protein
MEHLIANSGIHFICKEIEFNPSQPLAMPDGAHILTINMYEHIDPFSMQREFDYLVQSPDGNYIPLHGLINNQIAQPIKLNPNGTYVLDYAGLPVIKAGISTTLLETITEDADTIIHNIPTLESYRVLKDLSSNERVPAFELILDKWIPIPLYEYVEKAEINNYPTGWCRVKIKQIAKGRMNKYRLIYAIDTTTTDSLSSLQPYFYQNAQGEYDEAFKDFKICDDADKLQSFFFITSNDLNGQSISTPSSESNYFAQLLNIQKTATDDNETSGGQFKYLAYYSYLIMFLRHVSGLNVRLFNPNMRGISPIDVDLVLDIGNSKTCGILFENGDFTKREMLSLRDLTNPWKVYPNSFDMRIVFRQADFGNGIGLSGGENLFQWRSLLRIGEEANTLMHISRESEGLSNKHTNYSSPKRYIWDTDKFPGNWEFMQTESDPLQNRIIKTMYMDGLTDYLSDDGSYDETARFITEDRCQYSRSSLMMNVFLEIFRQAEAQINSQKFRNDNSQIDRPRRLKNIIITAPTAMPNIEQVRLRKLAQDAFNLMCKDGVERNPVTIIPSPDSIKARPIYDTQHEQDWIYDEATACQLVYLYAEIQERYGGDAKTFLELKGKSRKDMKELGFDTPVLTVGSIDIGAGTTDLMICSYGVNPANKIVPVPLFWDSFNLAGDDIMRSIVQCLILDGEHIGDENRGTISSVLHARLKKLSNEDFRKRLETVNLFSHRIDLNNILQANDEMDRNLAIERYAQDLLIDFFGVNTGNNNERDRRCRVDFNSQISVPLASYYMQLLSENRPTQSFTYWDIFGACQPAAYILEHFKEYFGFDFESIVWEYNPQKLSDEIRKVMTPLMEQLSILLHAYNVDIAMLAGRPTKLAALTDLFLKFYPVSPDRLVRLPKYEVGNWYPFSHGGGTITDQKTVVAVGAYIGFLASRGGLNGFSLDLSIIAKRMGATANYVGKYLPREHRVNPVFLSPITSNVQLVISSFPYLIGCKQLNTEAYESRPLYIIDWTGDAMPNGEITIILSRSYQDDKEKLSIDDAFDYSGRNYKSSIILKEQSMVDTESGKGNYWLDDGAFKFLSK